MVIGSCLHLDCLCHNNMIHHNHSRSSLRPNSLILQQIKINILISFPRQYLILYSANHATWNNFRLFHTITCKKELIFNPAPTIVTCDKVDC